MIQNLQKVVFSKLLGLFLTIHLQNPRRAPKPKAVVRDDWEDDEDDDELPDEETNKKIWADADSKVPAPMPVVNVSSSRSVASPPPAAAFQPALKILKRPTPNQTNVDSRTPSPASAESLKDREARYQAARNRIFGRESESGLTETPTTSPRILREPYGPQDNTDSAGFGKRQAKAPKDSSA
ncbi:hypothetical protein VNI00_009624 [Paramarasmius palmivorus]|uniref:SUZ domain-containing protein n=1 Tax=Paramarasmius palmivorus TaxID=297713 RepID=A0AAW0CQD3_9AGAR